jgi:hypothetical protein
LAVEYLLINCRGEYIRIVRYFYHSRHRVTQRENVSEIQYLLLSEKS